MKPVIIIAIVFVLFISAIIIPAYALAPFVDESKDPQHYIDRYNNEPTYKKWFDENYSHYQSIYEAVGIDEPTPEPEPTCGAGSVLDPETNSCILDSELHLQPQQELVVNTDIICGKGTIKKNGQCVVDTDYNSVSDSIPSKEKSSWFSWIFDFFKGFRFGFGEPNEISKRFTASHSEYISKGDLNLDKFENDLREKISQAQSPQEIEYIIIGMTIEVLDNPRVEEECKQVLIDLQEDQKKMAVWSESGKDMYSYPVEKTQKLLKQWLFCSAGIKYGVFDQSEWKELLNFNNP